jgi:hypothetical protein
MGAVISAVLLIVLIVALAQARQKTMERMAFLGLALTGITGLGIGLIALCTMYEPATFRSPAAGYALVGSAISFGVIAALSVFRPKP